MSKRIIIYEDILLYVVLMRKLKIIFYSNVYNIF